MKSPDLVRNNKRATFYIIKCSYKEEVFYKVGITNGTVKSRYKTNFDMPYSYEVVKKIRGRRLYIQVLEKTYIKLLKEYHYSPRRPFIGSVTECFTRYSTPELEEAVSKIPLDIEVFPKEKLKKKNVDRNGPPSIEEYTALLLMDIEKHIFPGDCIDSLNDIGLEEYTDSLNIKSLEKKIEPELSNQKDNNKTLFIKHNIATSELSGFEHCPARWL